MLSHCYATDKTYLSPSFFNKMGEMLPDSQDCWEDEPRCLFPPLLFPFSPLPFPLLPSLSLPCETQG